VLLVLARDHVVKVHTRLGQGRHGVVGTAVVVGAELGSLVLARV